MKELDIVLYKNKNEPVFITKMTDDDHCFTIGHFGSTAGRGSNDLFKELSTDEILDLGDESNLNQALILSYLERRLRLIEQSEHDVLFGDDCRYTWDEIHQDPTILEMRNLYEIRDRSLE